MLRLYQNCPDRDTPQSVFGVLIDPERYDNEGPGHFTELTRSITKIVGPITQCLAKRRQKRNMTSWTTVR